MPDRNYWSISNNLEYPKSGTLWIAGNYWLSGTGPARTNGVMYSRTNGGYYCGGCAVTSYDYQGYVRPVIGIQKTEGLGHALFRR